MIGRLQTLMFRRLCQSRGDGYGVVRSPASCFLGCIANSTEVCGGPYYGMSLYEDRNQVTAPYDPFAGTNWKDSGYCVLDSDTRVLVGWTDGVGYMTPQYCQCEFACRQACPCL